MEDDMAVDAALWLILAGMIGWVALGCYFTALRISHDQSRRR
jgi:hypothetical protein